MSSNAMLSQWTVIAMGAVGGPYTDIGEINSYNGFDGQAADIDVTTLTSTAKEFRAGLQDFGNFTLNVNRVFSDAGQIAVESAKASGVVREFQVTLSDAKIILFQGVIKSFTFDAGVDHVYKGSITVRMTGSPTFPTYP